jgi:integrase
MMEPSEWKSVTWGLIGRYREYMLKSGYSINTINQTIYIIKAYAEMAGTAGFISPDKLIYIKAVKGYKSKEIPHIDERRKESAISTRIGMKKAEATRISADDARRLKSQPDTPRGRRDALLMAILLDHGLRISEVIGLKKSNFNMQDRTFTFYRPKTNRTDTHRMTEDTFNAAKKYFDMIQDVIQFDKNDSIWTSITRKNDQFEIRKGLAKVSAQKRVTTLGKNIGIEKFSCHDCRHYFATAAHKAGTDTLDIMAAGGWATPAMVARYVNKDAISNLNVKLG